MSTRLDRFMRLAALAAVCVWATGAAAQAEQESAVQPEIPGLVQSDAQPLPAQDRDSHGAVLIHGAPVRAQQSVRQAPQPAVPARIGSKAEAVVDRTRGWDDVRDADAQRQLPPGEASGAGAR